MEAITKVNMKMANPTEKVLTFGRMESPMTVNGGKA